MKCQDLVKLERTAFCGGVRRGVGLGASKLIDVLAWLLWCEEREVIGS